METMMETEMPNFDASIQLPNTQIEVMLMVANLGKGKSVSCEKMHNEQHVYRMGGTYVSMCPKCIKELRDNTSKYAKRLMIDDIPIMEVV